MYKKIRSSFIASVFVFGLLASSAPVMAQDANVPVGPLITPMGTVLNPNEADLPVAGEIPAADLAADQEFQNKVAFVESLTEEQRAAFAEILAKYQPELEAIAKELQAAHQVFLPGIVGGNGEATAAVPSTSAPAAPQGTEPDPRVTEVLTKLQSIQDKINQELAALLTDEQKAMFEQVGVAHAPAPPSLPTAPPLP